MMKSYSSLVSTQIRFLLHTLNDSNSDSVFSELRQFMDHGSEGAILVLRTCLDHISFPGGDVHNMQMKPDFLAAIFRYLLGRPNFSTVFCEAFGSLVVTDGFPGELCEALNFSMSEKIGLGLALADSDIIDIRTRGQNFCLRQIEELRGDYTSIDSTEQIQNIIMFLYLTEGLTQHVDCFLQMLSLMEPKEEPSFVLAPFLSDDLCETSSPRILDLLYDSRDNELDAMLAEMESETSMADIMRELGYGCTLDPAYCKEVLSLFLPLTEPALSRILITLARTHSGLDSSQSSYPTFRSAAMGDTAASDTSVSSSWNINVLVDTIKELAPGTNWIRVMEHLDNESFYIPNEDAFSFFMSVYSRACKDPFPLHALCGSVWENVDGQLSFLRYAVSAPPDVFSFGHSTRRLEYSDAFNGHELPHGQANQAWLSLDLLELLCQLAERGYANAVQRILEFPLKHCPAILLLGISHINTAYNLLQRELCSTVLPMIVGNSLGSATILHLWQSNPQLVLHGFTNMIKRDEGDMSRLLEICQELKVLSHVLDQIPFGASIQMAAFSSEKKYLNLEKWLNNKLSLHKNVFFEECLRFLKDASVVPTVNVSANSFQHSRVRRTLCADTSAAFIKALQSSTEHFDSTHSFEELKESHRASIHVSSKPQDIGTSGIPIVDEYGDDIEAQANYFFHKIFSSPSNIEGMIQMLAGFRDSSNKREKTIFDCIVQNLFDEYKFFPKYPEKQLNIAAVLLGSLIKHQLVTHLTLGIALRRVLDAIRKPTDSKLFAFGIMAMDQFRDRLVEWPQYCNHILQISHLRGTHPELVAFIEHALARISSSNSEMSNIASTDPHNGFTLGSVENVEVPDSPWQILGSRSAQPAQISSPVQMQQRHQALLGDRHNIPTTTNYNAKPLLHSSGNQINIASGDGANSQKLNVSQSLQTAALSSVPANVSSSSVYLHSTRALNTNSSVPRQHSYSTGFGSALNIETLVSAAERRETPIEAPGSDVQEKILFLINNISSSNIEVKAKEFAEILDEQYYPWFAQYMVMKRASIEPNFHDLYLKFLEKFNSKVLNKEVVKAAYENCKVLLRSELIKSSSEERSLLKNLGSWLGKFTIGRNQVLRSKEIDPKALIIEAYEKGLMIAVIPFTSKILEPCQSSVAYRPPNPWTMAILSLLAEIYALPNLKMNLKFDIEVLFKNLGVDIKEIKPAMLLKDKHREMEGNPDFSNKDIVTPHPPVEPQPDLINAPLPGGHIQYPPGPQLSSGPSTEDEKITTLSLSDRLPSGQGLSQVAPSQSPYSGGQLPALIPNIGNHIIFNQKLGALGLQFLQRVLPVALERAIKEVMAPVVQRSVAIAIQTTKELVLKDYVMESDETRIYNAAHLMVASLAGSLAHVTCKEPLRASISTQLRNAFQGMNIANELIEQAVPLVMNDNLDLGCAVIEQAATDKALQTIDGEIAQQLSLRRKHREGVGSTYYDASMYTQGQLGVIPEALRPRPSHLTHTQQRVYEDFVRYPWQNQSAPGSDVGSAALPGSGGTVNSSVVRTYASSAQLNPDLYSSGVHSTGVGAGNHPVGLIAEEINAGSTQLLSGSSTHVVTVDGVTTHAVKINSTAPFPAQAAASDLLLLEASYAAKELGTTVVSLPTSTTELLGGGSSETLFSTKDALEKYELVAVKLVALVSDDSAETEIQFVIAQIPDILLKCVSRDEAALAMAQKVFQSLYENTSNSLHVGAHLAILTAIRDVCKLVLKEVTSWVMYSDEERKFNIDIIAGLIRKDLLNLAEYNMHMAKLIDAGRNKAATEFAISLLQALLVLELKGSISELPNVVDALAKLATRPGSPESLQQLVEIARNPAPANLAVNSTMLLGKEDRAMQSRDKKVSDRPIASREDYISGEPLPVVSAEFRDQVSLLFAEWCQIYELHTNEAAAGAQFISQLQQNGFLNGDDTTERFILLLMDLSVSHCLSSEGISSGSWPLQGPQQAQNISFFAIDVYAKLVVLIVKYRTLEPAHNKLFLLPKILSVMVKVILRDAEDRMASFNSRPYFRLFINCLYDLMSPEHVVDVANFQFQVLISFAIAFHALQPLKILAFSFAWLELVSHRSFMPKLLIASPPKGWIYIQRLLVDLFKFMEPYLRNADMGEPIRFLYKGTLRVLLVLLHDFPEFLCNYHFSFCDVIPSTCIQMRNVVLSAFPRNMRLPDPSTPNLKIDLLPEICEAPQIFSEVDAALKQKLLKVDIDEFVKTRHATPSFLSDLKQNVLLPPNEVGQAGTRYNIPLVNSLVLYMGMQIIQQLQAEAATLAPNAGQNAPLKLTSTDVSLEMFHILIREFDMEGSYHFLNAIANQLRYPNNHTHFYSFVVLYLFAEAKQEIIQEQITRVLLERLIVNRPHPWGLLITFIELIKNTRYNFWSRDFTRIAPEIEKLFESVARSCGPKSMDDSIAPVAFSDMH